MIRAVALRGGLPISLASRSTHRTTHRELLLSLCQTRGFHTSRLHPSGDSFDVVTPILAKKKLQTSADTVDKMQFLPPGGGGEEGGSLNSIIGNPASSMRKGSKQKQQQQRSKNANANAKTKNTAAAIKAKSSFHVRTNSSNSSAGKSRRPKLSGQAVSDTVAHTRRKHGGKQVQMSAGEGSSKVETGNTKTQSRKAEKRIEKQNYVDTHVALTEEERKLQHKLVESLIQHIKRRDHNAALVLYRQHESMFNSRMHLQSLLSVCWRYEHLSIAEELVEKLMALFSGASTGVGAAVPESALLSLIRCYTAVDTPSDLRLKHTRKALDIVRKLQKSNLEPRLRTYVPILACICRTGDVSQALDIVDEMGRAHVYLREAQIMMILATVANVGKPLSVRTQHKLMKLIDTSGVGLRVVPVQLLHTLLAAFQVYPSGAGSFSSSSSSSAGDGNTTANITPGGSNPMRNGNGVVRVGEKEKESEKNILSLSYWLNKMFGFSSSDNSKSNTNQQNHGNIKDAGANANNMLYGWSWGANGNDTTKMTLQELVADRGVMVNNRRDIPGQIVVDRLDAQRSDVWVDLSGSRGKSGNSSAMGHPYLDERLPGVAVAVNHYYSNPLDTPVLTRRNAEGDMTVAVFADDESGNGSGEGCSPGNFGPKFHSVQLILEKKAALEAAAANVSPEDSNFLMGLTAYQPKVLDNIYKEKFFLHSNPFEPFRNRHRTAKPAALVELTKMGDGANAAHVCPNCGDELAHIDLTTTEKAFMRNALMESARESGDASSLQTFANYLHHMNSQNQSQNQIQNQNQSRSKSQRQRQNQNKDVLYIVDGANVAYHRQNFVGGKFSYRQIELVVEKLEKKIAAEEAILVVLPHAYVQRVVPNMSKNFEKRNELLSKEDHARIDRLRAKKMLYVVPSGCNDDWYWMYATVSNERDSRAYVVTNDLMRDHKVAFSPSQKHSDACFKRWRENTIIHFDFSKAAEKEHPSPAVILVEPSPVTREMQTKEKESEKNILSLSYWLNKMFGFSSSDNSKSNTNQQNHGNIKDAGANANNMLYGWSWGANGNDTTKMTLQELSARESGDASSLQTFANYLHHMNSQNQSQNQIQNQNQSRSKSQRQRQNQNKDVLYIVDGANVAYHRQNFVGGKFSYRQIELVVEKLEKKIAAEEAILVVLPHAYVQRVVPNMSKNFEKRNELLSKEDHARIDRLRAKKMLYVVPSGCNDDWYWMYATVSNERDSRAYVVTNDLMRDHKVAFSPSQKHSDACFKRWRENTIIHFDFSKAAEKEHPSPAVILVEPSPVTREMQTVTQKGDKSGGKFPNRIHIPAVDRSSWGCFRLTPGSDSGSGSGRERRGEEDLTRVVELFRTKATEP
eukprot:GSChrysophyteH2.ASY1.ANO1.760.1 assembled CDS